jgi:hypothetical protein
MEPSGVKLGRMVAPVKLNAEGLPGEADDALDLDVPATVVCAFCGDADCQGCANDRSKSGIVAIVAWERSGPPFARMWSTARSASKEAELFFRTLPDGPIGPALRFAVLSELLASTAMLAFLVPFAVALAPSWAKHVALDPRARSTALRVLAFAVPALAALLVLAHAAHGLALDFGARKGGARSARRRALRFGLYATGWDVVVGPVGAAVLGVAEGVWAALGVPHLAVGLPGRSARAFLLGAYGLDGASASVALRTSHVTAVIATALGAILVLAGIASVALF